MLALAYVSEHREKLVPDRPIIKKIHNGRVLLSLLATSERELNPSDIARDWHTERIEAVEASKYYRKACEELAEKGFLTSRTEKTIQIKKTGEERKYAFYRLNYDAFVEEFSAFIDEQPSFSPLTKAGKQVFKALFMSPLYKEFAKKHLGDSKVHWQAFNICRGLLFKPYDYFKNLTASDKRLITKARKAQDQVDVFHASSPQDSSHWSEL